MARLTAGDAVTSVERDAARASIVVANFMVVLAAMMECEMDYVSGVWVQKRRMYEEYICGSKVKIEAEWQER